MRLVIHHPDAEPYELAGPDDLRDAIAAEADTVSRDAGSDVLEDPGMPARDALREQVTRDALAHLSSPDASYVDPLGVRWSLES